MHLLIKLLIFVWISFIEALQNSRSFWKIFVELIQLVTDSVRFSLIKKITDKLTEFLSL